jgi:enamine deaminase RidA (YjgF/YER057c/UK114 family)
VTTLQSGTPINVTISADRANIGISGLQRPDLIGSAPRLNCTQSPTNADLINCFDPSAFAMPAQYTFGNAQRNVLRGPKASITDLSMMKNVPIGGTVRLHPRGDLQRVQYRQLRQPQPGVRFRDVRPYQRDQHHVSEHAAGPAGSKIALLRLLCRAATACEAVLTWAGKNRPLPNEQEASMSNTSRRSFIRRGAAAAAAVTAGAVPTTVAAQAEKAVKKVHYRNGRKPEKTPLFSGTVSYGNLLFIAGIGAHFEGGIEAHTKHVLDQIQEQLVSAGSSMEKVLKCNVYLNDLKDYAGMNEVFQGRFGAEPPVRTTIAAAGGIPGNSLVEIDVIAVI